MSCQIESDMSLLVLNALPELGPVRIRNLINHFGSADKVLSAPVSALIEVEGIGRKIASNIISWEKYFDLKKECELIEKYKVSIITINQPEYPGLLKEIYDPPVVLYAKGAFKEEDKNSLAIVGSRRASYYGINTARRLSRELSCRGFTIVSGLARGVDTAAHEGAIQGNGRTIAVFGCGIDRIYPPENERLVNKIISQGVIISEFPFGTPPLKENFPKRNRVISGLVLGVIVVEAGRHSGSLITARLATEQGREVFSVPGRIDAVTSHGANMLIKHGAKPVLDVEDVLEEFGTQIHADVTQIHADVKISGLNNVEEKLFQSLTSEPNSVDEIVNSTDLPINEIWTNLVSLELKGLVKRLPGSRFVRK